MQIKYKFELFWSDEDEGYIATCPELPGLSAFGETASEALAEAQVALEMFLETYRENGISIPEPMIAKRYSGQIRLRLPKSLHARSAQLAADDGISLNDWLTLAVQQKVSCHDYGERFVREMRREILMTSFQNSLTVNLLEDQVIATSPLGLSSPQNLPANVNSVH
jgi:predicted RNase H-like HicB family nuclease